MQRIHKTSQQVDHCEHNYKGEHKVWLLLFYYYLAAGDERGADGLPLPSHLTNTVLTDSFFAIAVRLQIPSAANRPLFQRLCQQRASPIGKIHYYTCVW
jgi:hypothetical protein